MNLPQVKIDANVRLCRAVQEHPCVYDRSDGNYSRREDCDLAWCDIAIACEDSVPSCKLRWRNIRKAFIRSVIGAPGKRKGPRLQKYYLYDTLEFFVPYINAAEVGQIRDSDDEADSVKARRSSTTSDNKTKADEDSGEVDDIEKDGENTLLIRLESKNKEKIVLNKDDADKEENQKIDTKSNASKRASNARRKTLEKYTIDETRVKRRSQPSRNKSLENTASADEKDNEAAQVKSSKNAQTPQNTVGTFYISPKNNDTGSFFIKKNNGSSDTDKMAKHEEAPTNDEADTVMNSTVDIKDDDQADAIKTADETEDSLASEESVRRSRFKRACKRGVTKRRFSDNEAKAKGLKHNTERLKALAKSTLQLAESISTAKKESKMTQIQTKSTTNLEVVPADEVEMEVEPPTISAVCSPLKISTDTTAELSVEPIVLPPTHALTLQPPETTIVRVHQGVQCNLVLASTDDDFFSTLKPYLKEMNTRQKLHFKKKIFESLMEVFDSAIDFPDVTKPNEPTKSPTAIIPTQLKTVSGEEVRLVRELVAIVQAAKHTPELNLNASGITETVSAVAEESKPKNVPCVSVSVSTTVPPPPPPPLTLRNTPTQSITATGLKFPATLQVNKGTISPNLIQTANKVAPMLTTSTPLAPVGTSAPPLVQRRIIRKLVKMNDAGSGNYNVVGTSPVSTSTEQTTTTTNGDGLRRRILRIFPKSALSNNSVEAAVTSNGVGTFIVPRSTTVVTSAMNTSRYKVVTAVATPSTTSTPSTSPHWKQFLAPLNTSASPSNSVSTPSITIRNLGVTAARPLARRYSVCGAVPNITVERHNGIKILTTSANTYDVISAPKSTTAVAVERGSPAGFTTMDNFKIPTTWHSITTTATTSTPPVVTNTTASRAMPALSVTASDPSSSARTLPFGVGFNKFVRNDAPAITIRETPQSTKQITTFKSNTSRDSPSFSNLNTTRSPPFIVSVHSGSGVKRAHGLLPITAGKRICSNGEKKNTDECGADDMAGIIASDDFAAFNIKSEPIDEEF